MSSLLKFIDIKVWTAIAKPFLRLPIVFALFALPAPYQAGEVSGDFLEGREAFAVFHFVEGCITTDAVVLLHFQQARQTPGNKSQPLKFTVSQIRQASEPQNGPECADSIIQDSFLVSDDPVANFHPTVMEISPKLDYARVAGTASFFDFHYGVLRDMAFDITWQATSPLVQEISHEHFEGGQINSVFFHRDAIASGSIKECDNEFEGPVDGLCTPEDLEAAPNLLTAVSDRTQTTISDFRVTQIHLNP